MQYYFSAEELENKECVAILEDIVFECSYIEGEELEYMAFGRAIIDGESYNEFQVSFLLENLPEILTCSKIFNSSWVEYDYIFPI